MTASKPIVVAAIQPDSRIKVFPPQTEASLARVARVVNLGTQARFTSEQLAAALRTAHGVITCWGTPRITFEMARQAKDLKVIAHAAGSLRTVIDKDVLSLPIQVTSQAAAIAMPVAECTIGLILTGLRLTWRQDRRLQASRDWDHGSPPADLCWELAGRTVGVVSLSRVGRLVARKLAALEAKVIAYDPYAPADVFAACSAENVGLEDLFDRSSVVTLHAPVTDTTRGMIGADLLARLTEGGLLVNTARGVLFDPQALEAELMRGRLRAALDVTEPEPPPKDWPLYGLQNVLVTPHQAGLSVEARQRQGCRAVEDVTHVLTGQTLTQAISLEQWDISA
jgi:phosphoglycerate dehydrogenase-like enzyme